jgi:hypothetical protein
MTAAPRFGFGITVVTLVIDGVVVLIVVVVVNVTDVVVVVVVVVDVAIIEVDRVIDTILCQDSLVAKSLSYCLESKKTGKEQNTANTKNILYVGLNV